MNKEEDNRRDRTYSVLTYAYATPSQVAGRLYAKDFDPHLKDVRKFRTAYQLDQLVKDGRAEVREIGTLRLYRRKGI